jgi:hypothetical protein
MLTPTDQVLPYGQLLSYQLLASDPSGIDHYTVNDTVHFTISTGGGGSGMLTSIGTLTPGRYGLTVTAYDPYANHISATITITVQPSTTTTTTTTTPPIPGFPWPAILLASVAAVSLSLYRRRRPRR